MEILAKLGPNGTILKMNGTPYAVVDRGKHLQCNVRLAGQKGRLTRQVKVLVFQLLGVPFNPVTHKIIHLDGNYKNCDPSNLKIVSRAKD